MKHDLTGAVWHKSTRSGGQGDCVEVAMNLPGIVAVRDTKDPNSPELVFSDSEWRAFIGGVTDGEFTKP